MRRAAHAIFLALALTSIAGSVLAQDGMKLGVNESRRVVLHGSAANVIVGDPAIADVTMVDAHSVIVIGRGYGATSVMVLDHAGRTLLDSRVVISAPEVGRVTIHRGGMTSDYACSSRCQLMGGSKETSSQPGSGGGGTSSQAGPGPSSAPTTAPGV